MALGRGLGALIEDANETTKIEVPERTVTRELVNEIDDF